jgi:hypothetical protein
MKIFAKLRDVQREKCKGVSLEIHKLKQAAIELKADV